MTNRLLIGLLLGLTSAVVFASAATGPLFVRFLLFLLTPLPILLAGLGWGTRAAILAGAAGSGVILAMSPEVALLFAASQAAPAAVLSYLALLSRDGPPDADGRLDREWYPAGRLVAAAALMAGIPAFLWVLLLGGDIETLKITLGKPISEFIKAEMPMVGADGAPIGEADLARITEIILSLLPAGTAISWMGVLLFDLWLAGRIMLASGQLQRPWPDIAAMELPTGTSLALAATTLAAFLPGGLGLAASGFAGAFLFAYVLLGLAIIHYVTRATRWRPFLLWMLYASLFLFNAPLALPLAILGLAEPLLRLRDRAKPRPGGGPPART